MKSQQTDTRKKMVETVAQMLAQHGLNATSIREVAKRANTPLGSTYYNFPNGKQQVVVEAIEYAGQRVAKSLDYHLQEGATAGMKGFMAMWRDILLQSEFNIGCPVLAVAVEQPSDVSAAGPLQAAAAAFSLWVAKLKNALIEEGRDAKTAEGLATLVVAAAEGAIALCRAERSIDPFDQVADQILDVLSQS